MRLKKIIPLIMVFILLFSNSVFADTVEGGESNVVSDDMESSSNDEGTIDEGGEISVPVADDGSEAPGDASGDMGNAGGDSSSVIPMNEPLTVDVSEQSVNAIATAVVEASSYSYAHQYEIPTGTGSIVIDTDDDLSEYNIVAYRANANHLYLVKDGSLYVNTNGKVCLTGYSGKMLSVYISSNSVISYESIISYMTENVTGYLISGYITWSTYHVYDKNTNNLLFESALLAPVIFTVSFYTGFDDLLLDSVLHNDFVLPQIEYDGYKFDGWFLDEEFTKPYTTDYVFNSDTTLYAKWIPYRTISFVTNISDLELDSIQVLDGETYTFSGLSSFKVLGVYTDEEHTNYFVDGSVIFADTTLYLELEEYDKTEILLLTIIFILSFGHLYKFFSRFFRKR